MSLIYRPGAVNNIVSGKEGRDAVRRSIRIQPATETATIDKLER